jgi:transposase
VDHWDEPGAAAEVEGIKPVVFKHTESKKWLVLLPRRWVVERTFGWLSRFRRLDAAGEAK